MTDTRSFPSELVEEMRVIVVKRRIGEICNFAIMEARRNPIAHHFSELQSFVKFFHGRWPERLTEVLTDVMRLPCLRLDENGNFAWSKAEALRDF